MKLNQIKTIDVNSLEWSDKVNGNSYFAGEVIINYGMKNQKRFIMPYQYGYGEQYISEARNILDKELDLNLIEKYDYMPAIWTLCSDNNIIFRYHKTENCKKRELVNYN